MDTLNSSSINFYVAYGRLNPRNKLFLDYYNNG